MTQRRKPDTTTARAGPPRLGGSSQPKLSRWKLWSFRLFTLAAAPVVFLGLLELVLRLIGFGNPTSFLLPASRHRQAVFVQNNQFGWRFFGRDLARWPYPFSIAQSKPTNTVRIFVLGESAARGEPQPEFGLPRVLQAMLSLRHPGLRFEVVNTAMTAINSHAILSIARDCARAQGDIWVIYMGNNEVVGPFGAGTVFGSQTLPLPLIRASLTLKATRTGQLLDSGVQRLQESPPNSSVWGGMMMFLGQQVPAADSRLNGVYSNFDRNLVDIIRAGRRAGASVVVSTVAVNLKDCPPFASAHRPGFSASDQAQWDQLYESGIAAQHQGKHREAAAHFSAAAELDEAFAALRYRQGQSALALGELTEAQRHFRAARDLDTLRFRCDSRLNELIRKVTENQASELVLLADAERTFAQESPYNLAGDELFYEHVHFRFAGNYLLARTLAEQVERLLPKWVAIPEQEGQPWPTFRDCARRLGRSDWHEAAALNSMITILNDPPFPGQLGHEARMRRLEAELGKLAAAIQPAGIAEAIGMCEPALKATPDDPLLYRQLAGLKKASGDLAGAASAARQELELLPNDSEGWSLLGSILAQQGQLADAADAFRRGFHLGPQGIKSALDLAGALGALGRETEAIREYEQILAKKPRCVPALLQLGLLVEKLGRMPEAENYFHQALTNRSQRLPELMELGAFFQSRGAFQNAADVYRDALRLNPASATLHLSVARNLASQGRYEEAVPYAVDAVRLAPDFAEARLMHGITLWRRGKATEAMEEFQTARRLQPESLDARVNLGIVLAQQGQRTEALMMFREVLQRSPTHPVALKYVQSLTDGASERSAAGRGKPE